MSKKDEKDINISKLDKSLEGQGLLEDADDAEYERTLAQQRREAEERERQVLEQAEAERRERERQEEKERERRLAQERIELMKLKSGVIDESESSIKEEHDQIRELHGFEKVQNFFYHNKVWIIFAIFIIAVAAFIFIDAARREKADLTVLMIANNGLETRQEELEEFFEKYTDDLDGNGYVHVEVIMIPLNSHSDDYQQQNVNSTKFLAQLQGGESILVITDSNTDEEFKSIMTPELPKEFPNNKKAKSLFADYVKDIITRINRYTNISYVEDPTIMSWQIGNEPRAFSGENKEAFAIWMAEVSRFIKSLDRNHLVSTGSEGKHGCEEDLALFERIHADKHIDYMNIHIWPYNWGWAPADSLSEKAEAAQLQSKQYIDEHLEIAQKYGKPLVLEEFGYPRDGFRFDKSATTQARDTYYQYIFSLITDRTAQSAGLTGCNFWAWGGLAAPKHLYWQRGDDYTGDPAQEQQGLNWVFMSDSTTIAIIRTANQQLKQHSF